VFDIEHAREKTNGFYALAEASIRTTQMTTRLDLSVEAGDWPPEPDLRRLAESAVAAAEAALAQTPSPPLRGRAGEGGGGGRELSLVLTDDAAVRRLNARYRGKDKPTNVLSFPQAAGPLLGDIVLAAETVRAEAALAEKPLEDHVAHLIIHGFLHLLGHDHEAEEDAETMEALERAALEKLGIPDPYAAARQI
jgi:probable rRNA maturation factor